MAKRSSLFERENAILRRAREASLDDKAPTPQVRSEFNALCAEYEDLLDQLRLITKVSDRLQNKLQSANGALEQKNVELQETLDRLTQARIGRRAATITLVLAVVLFLVSEALIEPQIEAYVQTNYGTNMGAALAIELTVKGFLALMLKPIEVIVERTLMKRAMKAKALGKSQEAIAA